MTKIGCDRTSKSFLKAMDVWCSYTYDRRIWLV